MGCIKYYANGGPHKDRNTNVCEYVCGFSLFPSHTQFQFVMAGITLRYQIQAVELKNDYTKEQRAEEKIYRSSSYTVKNGCVKTPLHEEQEPHLIKPTKMIEQAS